MNIKVESFRFIAFIGIELERTRTLEEGEDNYESRYN